MLTVLLALAASGSMAETDMEAQLRSGKMLCSDPNVAQKTCSNIDRLDVAADGSLINTGEKLLSPSQAITMEVKSLAHFENGAMCGSLDLADLDKGTIRVGGHPLPADRNAAALEKLATLFKPMAGMKACESLRINEGKLVKIGQIQGVATPISIVVRWITPDEGYRVAPASNPAQ